MRYLLDTQILLWLFNQSPKLDVEIKNTLSTAEAGELALSVASLWEITLKVSAGKLVLPVSLATLFQLVEDAGIQLLPLTPELFLQVEELPLHHRDPFDRAITASALHYNLLLISSDTQFSAYDGIKFWQNQY